MELSSLKFKKLLIFLKMELFSSNVKKLIFFSKKFFFLYFRRKLAKPEKQKMTADLVCMLNPSNNVNFLLT